MTSRFFAVAFCICAFTLALCSAILARFRKDRTLWILASSFTMIATGTLFISLQTTLPGILTDFMAQALLVSGIIVTYSGIRSFYNDKPLWPSNLWIIFAVLLANSVYARYVHYSYFFRGTVLNLVAIFIFSIFYRYVRPKFSSMPKLVVLLMNLNLLGNISVFALRTIFVFLFAQDSDNLIVNDVLGIFTFSAFMVSSIFWFTIFVLLESSILLDRLQLSNMQLEEMNVTDALTGLYNRKYFQKALKELTNMTRRLERPISIVLFDLDHFKTVNDRFGHDVGDRVLARTARLVKEQIRSTDHAIRWGGEEFVVIALGTPLEGAALLAEYLRSKIEHADFGEAGRLTASFGVAEFQEGETPEAWFKRADEAMYAAKQGGRNQVRRSEPESGAIGVVEMPGTSFVRLVWHKSYESGNAVIDRQHRELFSDAAVLLDALVAGRPAPEVEGLVDRLAGHIVRHFRDEEAILKESGYADAEAHALIHAGLVERATDLVARFKAGTLDTGELFQFLVTDVVALHMLKADREFFGSVGDARSAASSLPRRLG
jgi:diguanylate cyclase (GGDEF)-like protein/hemerythrin-like metal-binding protein